MKSVITNALTIDVEDYFQVSAFANHISRSEWNTIPCRVEQNITRLLELLDQEKTQATFFTLGWIAERYPHLVRSIVDQGHELASHGYAHLRATEQSEDEFRDDVTRSKEILEDISGVVVKGYRAPSFSIGSNNLWALDILNDAGYEYSSSIYPIKHDHYGMPDAPRFSFRPRSGKRLWEFPVTTVDMFGRNWPTGGGGYFRFFPYAFSRWMMQRVNSNDQQPCIFYFHPWEIDADQPRQMGIGMKTRFRHYVNLKRMPTRLKSLLRDFQWGRMDRIFLESQP